MGLQETEVKIKTRNSKIQKAILQAIAAAGILSVALLAPNALKLLKVINKNKNKKHSVNISRERMIKNGLIKYGENGFLCVTELGRRRLREIEANNFKFRKPNRWDGKWRILIFDIKEKRKGTRDKIRKTLITIGFVKLQNSVWIYPYDCEDFITMLKADFKIGKDLLYIIADNIENDFVYKKLFKL